MRFSIAAAVIAASIFSAHAQQPERTYTLTLTVSEAQAVWMALHKAPLPREVTDPAVKAIDRQITEQNAKAEKPAEGEQK